MFRIVSITGEEGREGGEGSWGGGGGKMQTEGAEKVW